MYKKNLNNDYSHLVDFLVSLCDANQETGETGDSWKLIKAY